MMRNGFSRKKRDDRSTKMFFMHGIDNNILLSWKWAKHHGKGHTYPVRKKLCRHIYVPTYVVYGDTFESTIILSGAFKNKTITFSRWMEVRSIKCFHVQSNIAELLWNITAVVVAYATFNSNKVKLYPWERETVKYCSNWVKLLKKKPHWVRNKSATLDLYSKGSGQRMRNNEQKFSLFAA